MSIMSESALGESTGSLELKMVRQDDDVDKTQRHQSISSPSSSSISSSSSWPKRKKCGLVASSESETSLEYPETPITEEFRQCTAESPLFQAPTESRIVSSPESHNSLNISSDGAPPLSPIVRRPGQYGRGSGKEGGKARTDKTLAAVAHQSLPFAFSSLSPSRQTQSTASPRSSHLDKVVQETVYTEKSYVKDLRDILRGYMLPLNGGQEIRLSRQDMFALFGNVKDIYKFNKKFLENLKKCGLDAVKVGKCFINMSDGFKVYAEYCTNYPKSIELISRYSSDPRFVKNLKHLQDCIQHPLPLQTYLFKPVQRILKYHLLLKNIVGYHDESLPGHDVLVKAYDCMTNVAEHINEMKRNQERRAEIQKQLLGSSGMDLSGFGDLIIEDKFGLSGAREVHYAFLFRKGLLIAKKRREDQLQLKTTIMCSNLMLVESVAKEPLSFNVIPFDSAKTQFTLQARTREQKQRWCHEIKSLMLDSYNVAIPEKARQLLMRTGNARQERDKSAGTSERRENPEQRHLRRQSISSTPENKGRNVADSSYTQSSVTTGRSSEDLLSISIDDHRSKGSRSRPLVVSDGLHRQKSERRSQSLDSLRSMVPEDETLSRIVKSEQKKPRSEREEQEQRKRERSGEEAVKHVKEAAENMSPERKRKGAENLSPERKRKGAENISPERNRKGYGNMLDHENRLDQAEEIQSTITVRQKRRNSKKKNNEEIGSEAEKNNSVNCSDDKIIVTSSDTEPRNVKPNNGVAPGREAKGKLQFLKVEDSENGLATKPKVARSMALRANSFRKAVDLNRVDSIVVKRSKVKVRRKRSEEPQERDSDEEDKDNDSILELTDEGFLSKFPRKFITIINESMSESDDDDDLEEYSYPSIDRHGESLDRHGSGGKGDDHDRDDDKDDNEDHRAGNDSRNSSLSGLSTTLESFPALDLTEDATEESLEEEDEENSSDKDPETVGNPNSLDSRGRAPTPQNEQSDDQSTTVDQSGDDKIVGDFNKEDGVPDVDRRPSVTCSEGQPFHESDTLLTINDKDTPPENSGCGDKNITKENMSGEFDVATSTSSSSVDSLIDDFHEPSVIRKEKESGKTRTSYVDIAGALSEALVRNSSSAPSLFDDVMHHGTDEQRTLLDSRKLSSSDLTGYFSHSNSPTIEEPSSICPSVIHGESSDKETRDQTSASKKHSSSPVVESNLKAPFDVNQESEDDDSSQESDAQETLRETDSDDDEMSCSKKPGPSHGRKQNRPRLYFEKVHNPSISSPKASGPSKFERVGSQEKQDSTNQSNTLVSSKIDSPISASTPNRFERAGSREKRDRISSSNASVSSKIESPIQTSRPSQFEEAGAIEKRDRPTSSSTLVASNAGSPNESDRPRQSLHSVSTWSSSSTSDSILCPPRQLSRNYDRRHTYVYRLARAYSNRVKQIQKEVAVFKKASGSLRPLRKWSTVDEGTPSLNERPSSLSEKVSKNSPSAVSQSHWYVDFEESRTDPSSADAACSDSLNSSRTRKDSNVEQGAERSCVRSESGRKPAAFPQFFGLSLDSFPDFCLKRGNDDSGSDDCFDDAGHRSPDKTRSSTLVKQRVKLFEDSKPK